MDSSVPPEEEEEFVDSSSESSILSEGWQDLSKSDFAKVIFCEMYYSVQDGTVGCKFQITDNVHEDPCDYVGLFKIGNSSQCYVSKMLSETECEEDGKVLSCHFSKEEMPGDLPDGFYHFQYVTRDGEVCGASTPVEIKGLSLREDITEGVVAENDNKECSSPEVVIVGSVEQDQVQQAEPKEYSSDEDIVTENAESDFVLVEHILEKKNRMLADLLEKFRTKNLALSSDLEVLLEDKSKLCQEKEEIIDKLHQEILYLKAELGKKDSTINARENTILYLSKQLQNSEQAVLKSQDDFENLLAICEKCGQEKLSFQNEVQLLKEVLKERESLPAQPDQCLLIEQLEDQKFMISALEDSKQLAMKEMSDLSESLSKRTKVLNQTRSELAACKLKLKQTTSLSEKQNEEIVRLKHVSKRLKAQTDALLGELEVASAKRARSEIDPLTATVNELYSDANDKVERLMFIVDELMEKIDFLDVGQEKAFHRLKIMFFVILGKMKKPRVVSKRESSSQTVVHEAKNNEAKPHPTLRRSTTVDFDLYDVERVYDRDDPKFRSNDAIRNYEDYDDEEDADRISGKNEDALFLKNEVVNYYEELSPENILEEMNKTEEIIRRKLPNITEEDRIFLNDLMDSYNSRPKFENEDPSSRGDCEIERTIDDMLSPSAKENILRLKNVFAAAKEHLHSIKQHSNTSDIYLERVLKELTVELFLQDLGCMGKTSPKVYLSDIMDIEPPETKKLKTELEMLKSGIEKCTLDVKLSEEKISELLSENERKTAVINALELEKDKLLKSEHVLKENIKEYDARLTEAADLYKKQYIEKEKLKKKLLRHTQGHSSKMATKVVNAVGCQSSSSAEDVTLLKMSETAPPYKKAKKSTAKIGSPNKSDKQLSPDRQQPALKVMVKPSFLKYTDKACSKMNKRSLPVKTVKIKSYLNFEAFPTQSDLGAVSSLMVADTQSCDNVIKLSPCPLAKIAKEAIAGDVDKQLLFKAKMSAPLRSVSDSDTGEHVLKAATATLTEGDKLVDNKSDGAASGSIMSIFGKTTASQIEEYFKSLEIPAANYSAGMSLQPGDRDLRTLFKEMKEGIIKVVLEKGASKEGLYDVPCILCDKVLSVTAELILLMDHMEEEHQISMCPVCFQLFEASFPRRFLIYHVEDHFNQK